MLCGFLNQNFWNQVQLYLIQIQNMKFLIVALLACIFVCSLANLNIDFNQHLKTLAHNSKINHRFRVSHFAAKYTPQQKKFMDGFNNQLMGFIFGDSQIMATLFSGQNLTDSESQRLFQFMLNNKDFPKFLALQMRNDTSNAWLAKLPEAKQIKFANIVITQMKGSSTMELTSDDMRKIMINVLNDKDLAKVFINNQKDFDFKKLTTQKELANLQKKYPALSKINPKKVTDDDKVLIMKTLISDDQFWNANFKDKMEKSAKSAKAV